jgi:hypothetical protein
VYENTKIGRVENAIAITIIELCPFNMRASAAQKAHIMHTKDMKIVYMPVSKVLGKVLKNSISV